MTKEEYMAVIEGKRYNLAELYEVDDAKTRESSGVSREGVWVTKSGRVIVETYSIWESSRHDGTCVGRQYHFAHADEIASLAAELEDKKLLALVPIATE